MADFNGSSGDDIFTGGLDNDTAAGNSGNDQLSGGGGHDKIGGGAGADTVSGNDGSDTLYSFDISPPFNQPYYGNAWIPPVMDVGIEFDILSGGAGSDTLFAGYGDQVDGGADSDVLYISFLGAPSGVTVDFRQLYNNGSITIGGGTLSSIEGVAWIEGSNFDDDITDGNGSASFAPMFGHGGNDRLVGTYYSGNAYGGDGNDYIDRTATGYGNAAFGDAGNDTIIGGSGYENLDGGDGDDIVQGNYGFDTLFGGAGNDTLDGGSFGDTLSGGAGNDTMYGAGDADIMDGGAGDDTLYGDFSLISMSGGLSPASNDEHMFGGTGADIIHGDQGNDTIWSGERDGEYGSQGKDDAGLEHDQLFGDVGNDALAIGFGDDADGGTGSDTLRISLAGAASGVTFSTAGFTPGGSWSVNGGTIQNVETLTIVRGSAFADTVTIATHTFGINVEGGDGDDVITSFNSSIVANGGNGNDRFINGNAGDTIDGGTGIDTVDYRNAAAGVTVTLAAVAGQTGSGPGGDSLKNVENIDGSGHGDTLNGSDDANLIYGMAGNDTINGKGGNDTIIGGDGLDQLHGGTGNDVFYIDDASGDVVHELAGEGSDKVYVALTYALAGGSEIEVLSTNDYASTAAINLTGNSFGQALIGNAGDNVLFGGGGTDLLIGLGGRDIYYTDVASTQVTEYEGGGTDTLYVSVSYVLGAGEVEVLSTNNYIATDPLNLTGNIYAQTIIGNAGANHILGGGGTDLLIGLGGNDIYHIDVAATQVVEYEGGGNDAVYVATSYILGSGEVETLSANNYSSTQAINLTGNVYSQILIGNAGANTLHGGGGIDTLIGLGGDDTYYIDVAGTQVSEAAGAGSDAIYTSVSFALAAGNEVERLSSNDYGATSAINLTGNALVQSLTGNAGANTLDGGAGADALYGMAGADNFAFTTTLGGGNIDTIADFSVADDTIQLDDAIFTAIGAPGALNPNAFVTGSAAADADDRIVYNSATGQLLYDADGSGAGAAVQFASLASGLTLTATDLMVI